MLLEDQHFYTLIEQRQTEDGFVESTIKLNEQHPIYKGHFPQQAVVPGVCMMQLIAELTSKALKQALSIRKAQQAKFLIPMAISLGYGILFATLICLLLVPALYLILEDVHILFTGRVNKKE